MPFKRSTLAAIATFALTATSSTLATPNPTSALLINGNFAGKDLRILVDTDQAKADVTIGNDRLWVDLTKHEAHRVAADGTMTAQTLAAQDGSPAPEIKAWGPGPKIAGHASVYHVMTLGDEICGELLVSTWMKPFVDPAVQALAILERLEDDVDLTSTGLDGACGALPFSSYATAGWPLMAGSIDQPIFTTETISFDYEPRNEELIWLN